VKFVKKKLLLTDWMICNDSETGRKRWKGRRRRRFLFPLPGATLVTIGAVKCGESGFFFL
jgi:hypothetical protein